MEFTNNPGERGGQPTVVQFLEIPELPELPMCYFFVDLAVAML